MTSETQLLQAEAENEPFQQSDEMASMSFHPFSQYRLNDNETPVSTDYHNITVL